LADHKGKTGFEYSIYFIGTDDYYPTIDFTDMFFLAKAANATADN